MLVLSRKPGESIIIGDGIEVRVCKIDGDVVRLSVEAPRKIAIYRKELYDEIRESNRDAALQGKQQATLPRIGPAMTKVGSSVIKKE